MLWRLVGESSLESRTPMLAKVVGSKRERSRRKAVMVTGPARGPRPTSSIPKR